MGTTCKTCISNLINKDEIVVEKNKEDKKIMKVIENKQEKKLEEEKPKNDIDNNMGISMDDGTENVNFIDNNKENKNNNNKNNNIELNKNDENQIILNTNKVEVQKEKNLSENNKENENGKKDDNHDNKILTLNFYDEQGNKNYPLKINLSNYKKFYLIIGKLYEEYPEFEDNNIKNYIFNKKNIKRSQITEDLGLEDSCKINIQFF